MKRRINLPGRKKTRAQAIYERANGQNIEVSVEPDSSPAKQRKISLKTRAVGLSALAAAGLAWSQHNNYDAAVAAKKVAAANEISFIKYQRAHMRCLNRNVVVHTGEYKDQAESVGRKIFFLFNKNNSGGQVSKNQEYLLVRPYIVQREEGSDHSRDKIGFMFQEDIPPTGSTLSVTETADKIQWFDADIDQLLADSKIQSGRNMTGYPLMQDTGVRQDFLRCSINADGHTITAGGERAAYAVPGLAGQVESVLEAFGVSISSQQTK